MKKILEVCLSPDLGGLELYMKNITKYLYAKAIISNNSKLKKIFIEEKMDFFEVSKYNILKIAQIIDKEEIDIVHIHWTRDIPKIVLAKLISKRKPKLIQTRHMHMTGFKSDFYHKFLYKNIYIIICVTNLVKKQLNMFIPKDSRPKLIKSYIGTVTPNILNNNEKAKLKKELNINNEFLVCIVGRIEEPKGQHIVLQAVQKLKDDGINAKALIVGHYMNEEYFKNLKSNYNQDIFTGFISNPTDYMQISDCLVLATSKETFGLVLIEAMKCNICVLASNRGGPTEIIKDKISGLLFESMNYNSLYQKLKLIYEDNNLKEKLIINAKNRVDTYFDSIKQFEEIKKIIKSEMI